MLDGLVVVDKPSGWTSHDVVAKLRGVYGQRRIGHAGTLDPDATGVLLVGLGRVTRLLRFLQETTKEYLGAVMFGVATSTLDAAGEVLDRRPMPITREQVEKVTPEFMGEIQQVPPMVSAIKIDGQRLHELARRGKEVERSPRSVRIDRLDVEGFEPGDHPVATIRVECSSGTYIRSLAADLGSVLDGCAHLVELRRLRVGPFTLADAHELEQITANPEACVLSPREAMRALKPVIVDDDRARSVGHGASFPMPDAALGAGPFAVVDDRGRLLAVYERDNDVLKPTVVVAVNRELETESGPESGSEGER